MIEFFFKKRNTDNRRYMRREKAYSADWTPSADVAPIPIIGLDVSASGAGILTREPIEVDEFILRLKLDARVIPTRVKKARSLPGTLHGMKAFRYGVAFVSIAADDWDAVVRWTKGESSDEVENKAQGDLQMVRMTADDANRLMPLALQNRLLQGLVKRGRLAQLDPNALPLVQYFYGGTVLRNGINMHRLAIISRVSDSELGTREEFRTLFYFDDAGQRVEMGD